MNNELMNRVYLLSLEFGVNWRKSILEIVREEAGDLPLVTQEEWAHLIEETRNEIEKYLYERYDYQQVENNKNLARDCRQWIINTYPWMKDDVIRKAISQGLYYAWHG